MPNEDQIENPGPDQIVTVVAATETETAHG